MTGDSIVVCTNCGKNESVEFARCLRNGWPKCCGYTMRLEVAPDLSVINAAVRDALTDHQHEWLSSAGGHSGRGSICARCGLISDNPDPDGEDG
jgi:hypothetical protein